MSVRKQAETPATITLAWDEPEGGEQYGYVPLLDGSETLTDGKAHLAKSSIARSCKIGKPQDGSPHRFGVKVLVVAAAGEFDGEAAGGTPRPTAPSPSGQTLQEQARNIIFASDHALKTAIAPPHYARALTADPAYGDGSEAQDFKPMAEIVAALRAVSTRLYAWGNQAQIGVTAIKDFCSRWGLDGCIYQSETKDELRDIGVDLDGRIIAGSLTDSERVIHIGNVNEWTAEQRATVTALVEADRMAVVIEVYNNLMPWIWPNTYDSKGVPPASWAPALYDGSAETANGRYTSTAEYAAHCDPGLWKQICPYTSGGTRDADLIALP